jgi:hypothetical protein
MEEPIPLIPVTTTTLAAAAAVVVVVLDQWPLRLRTCANVGEAGEVVEEPVLPRAGVAAAAVDM